MVNRDNDRAEGANLVDVEIAGEFSSEDYAKEYVCVGAARKCSPHITITADGVWFRTNPGGLQHSAHRQCLSQ